MGDEEPELLEGAAVEQELQALARDELARRVQLLDPFLSARAERLLALRLQLFDAIGSGLHFGTAHDTLSLVTRFSSTPTFSISHRIVWPGWMKTFGSRWTPTPEGVPVAMTSPASSVIPREA